jgi:hypothetical protein
VGDSHVRGCAANVKHILGKTETATGYVNPVSNLQQLTKTVKNDITNMTKKDALLIWGGANDITKNEAGKGLLHLFKLIDLCTNTNIIVEAPKRHNLPETSCVNDEVKKFNRKLHKIMRVYRNVKVINSVSQRAYFMKHGLRLNNIGREEMASRIIKQFKDSFRPNESPPIFLQWTKVPSVCDLPNLDYQSSSTTSTVMQDHCHQSTSDSASLDVTSTDSKLKNLLNDHSQSSSTTTSTVMPDYMVS